jgi:hypothetical protein
MDPGLEVTPLTNKPGLECTVCSASAMKRVLERMWRLSSYNCSSLVLSINLLDSLSPFEQILSRTYPKGIR